MNLIRDAHAAPDASSGPSKASSLITTETDARRVMQDDSTRDFCDHRPGSESKSETF
jgi:hypothetical protein